MFKACDRVNTLAWNNTTGLWAARGWSVVSVAMIERSGRGHSYSTVRGEILGFVEGEHLRKRLPRTYPLIKNESWGIEDD